MKVRTFLFSAALLAGVTSAGLADKHSDLVAQGYRWVTVDGPFGATSVTDLQQIVRNYSEGLELQMVEQLRTYYLTPGTLVQVVQEDRAKGVSEIRVGGVTRNLWTLSKFLSKSPVRDVYGVIETPEQTGTLSNPSGTPALDQSALSSGSPTPAYSPTSAGSPTPAASPEAGASPETGASPEAGASPTPTASPVSHPRPHSHKPHRTE